MTALAENWAVHVAHLMWQATLAGVVLLAVSRLFSSASSHLRHALLLLATLKFVLPPMLPLPVGLFSAAPPVPELTMIRDSVFAAGTRLLVVLMLIHAAGVIFMSLRLLRAAWKLRGIVRRSVAVDGIRISSEIEVPMAAGVFRPSILIPLRLAQSLSPDDLAGVIAHEAQHIRSGDVALNIFQAIVTAVWWFHPIVHLLEREGRALREERCDDSVIGAGVSEPVRYARTLLNAATAATSPAPFAAAAIAESRLSLLRRIRRIGQDGFAPRPRMGRAALLAVIIAALLLLPGLRVSDSNRIAFDHATRHALHH